MEFFGRCKCICGCPKLKSKVILSLIASPRSKHRIAEHLSRAGSYALRKLVSLMVEVLMYIMCIRESVDPLCTDGAADAQCLRYLSKNRKT